MDEIYRDCHPPAADLRQIDVETRNDIFFCHHMLFFRHSRAPVCHSRGGGNLLLSVQTEYTEKNRPETWVMVKGKVENFSISWITGFRLPWEWY